MKESHGGRRNTYNDGQVVEEGDTDDEDGEEVEEEVLEEGEEEGEKESEESDLVVRELLSFRFVQ